MHCKQTLYQTVLDTANKHPEDHALLFMNQYIDYQTLIERIDSLSNGLAALGIKEGDTVTLALPNVFEAMFSLYALNKLGVVLHLVHPLTPVKQMIKFMAFTGSKRLFIMDTFYDHFKAVLDKEDTTLVMVSPVNEFGFVKKLGYALINRKKRKNIPYGARVLKLETLYAKGQTPQAKVDALKTAFLLHSGGTSGEPKTIELSNYAINYLASKVPYVMDRTDFQDRHMLAVLPMFHGFGLCMGLHGMLMHGGVDTLMPKFSADTTIKLIKKDQCNFIIGVPSLFEALLHHDEFRMPEIKNLEQAYVGGDYVALDLKNRFDEVMEYYYAKARMLEGYGLTEVVTVSCVNTLNDHNQASVGKPLPGIEMNIVDSKTNQFLPPNTDGEIVVHGPTMMNGYLKDPKATKQTIVDIDGLKWVKTGDLGYMDESGYVFFKQRLKRIIKVSGMPVLPAEIENLLMNEAAIKEVAAISKPDQSKGHVVKLFVVWNKGVEKLSDQAIKTLIKENISPYAVPKEIVEMQELPKTIVGKTNVLALEKL